MIKQRLLHLGYPKCMSTSLQRDFFDRHPEIYFLGSGKPETAHGWISDGMASLGEVGLRYSKEFTFDKASAKDYLKNHYDAFENDDTKRLLCFSSESMSFTMHYDIDVVEKAKRLHYLFGSDSKILLVIRNQLDLLRSYYFECVRSGYPGFFGEFIEYHYFHQFRSILSDLYYDRMYDLYAHHFGKRNVVVIPMESLVKDIHAEMENVCSILGISSMDVSLEKHNDSNDKNYLQAVRLLNEKFPNNMGSTYFGMTDADKLEAYWKVELKEQAPPGAIKSNSNRMLVYRAARDVVKDFVSPLSGEYPDNWKTRFEAFFAPHNRRLEKKIGLDLRSMGYP